MRKLLILFSILFGLSSLQSSSLDFDGAGDYVGVSNPVEIPDGFDAYTMAAWIKPSNMGTRGIVGWGTWGSSNTCNALRLMGNTSIRHYWWGKAPAVNCC